MDLRGQKIWGGEEYKQRDVRKSTGVEVKKIIQGHNQNALAHRLRDENG